MNTDASRRLQPEDLWSLKFVGDPQVAPDGGRVAFVVTALDRENDGYVSRVWIAETDDPTSARPLTNPPGDSPIRETMPRWSPDGTALAFASNREGPNHIWLIDPSGGEAVRVSDHTGNYAGLNWSPTGSALTFVAAPPPEEKEEPGPAVYSTNRLRYKFNGRGLMRDSRRNAVWSMDVSSGKANRLTEAWWDDANPVYSPDGEYIYFVSDRYPEEDMYYVTDLYRVPAAGGDVEKITDGEGPVATPTFSPDGRTVAFVGHSEGDDTTANLQLMCMDADGGPRESLTSEIDRSVGCSVGSDSRFDGGSGQPLWIAGAHELLFNLTDGGKCGLYRVGEDSPPRQLRDFPPVITSFSASSDTDPVIAAVGADWNTPGDLWVMNRSGEVRQFTDLNRDLLGSVMLSRPIPTSYSGAEGWPMEGWIMEPVGRESGRKYPLVLEIHGGPASTSGDCFFFEYQLLAASGWGVMYNNPRGSKGYGEKHARGVIGEWGRNDYRDLMAALDRAEEEEWVDRERLGVTGGSYGGYMTNWMVTQTDRFRAAVTFRSISNLYTKYGCSDIGFYHNRKGMGGADLWTDEDLIMSRSPIRYAPQVDTPILIVHSEEDYRCPMEQAEQWYTALKRLGVTCQFVRYAGENHELSRSGRPHNRMDRLERLVHWFQTYLDAGDDDEKER